MNWKYLFEHGMFVDLLLPAVSILYTDLLLKLESSLVFIDYFSCARKCSSSGTVMKKQ